LASRRLVILLDIDLGVFCLMRWRRCEEKLSN
jgi:hypothetical protein